MASRRVRLGLIGCGANMRNTHLPHLRADGAVDLVGVADPDRSAADALIAKWDGPVRYYDDYRSMVRSEKPGGVIISSPHALHYPQALYCLQRGAHVLIEKPLTISARHTRSLLSIAASSKRVVAVSYQRHYTAAAMHVRHLIRTGRIGEVRSVFAYVTQNWTHVGGWRLVPELAGGGMFIDTGSHLVAAALWLTDLVPVEVSSFFEFAGKAVDINGVVNVRFKGGAIGTLHTLGDAAEHDERITIHGRKGSIALYHHAWALKSVQLNDRPLQIPKRVKSTSPDAWFLRSIRSGGRAHEPPVYAVQVARLTEAAYRSQELGRTVRIRPVK